MLRTLVELCLSIAVMASCASAHEGPHHDIERLTKLLATEPGRVEWLIDRARAYRLDEQYSKSLEDLDRAAALNGDAAMISLERGLTLSSCGRDAQAESELSTHLAGPNPKASAYAERAVVRERCGRAAEAVSDLSAAIALLPKVEWYCRRGNLQRSLGRMDAAADGFREGLVKCSGSVAIRLELLDLEIGRGRYDAATKLIDEALPQANLKTDWYLRRAVVQDAAGRPEAASADRARALAEAERAVARRPTGLRLLARARVHIALQQKDKATADLQAALHQAPALQEAVSLLKQLELETGAMAEARAKNPP